MAVKSDVRQMGDRLKSQFDDAVDHASSAVSGAASAASDAVRTHTSRVAESAQDFYDELEGDNPGEKLRGVIAEYPLASIAVAGAAGFLLARWLRV